ncbi:MAG: glycoside hydrolase family 36 N-terminal domain-containing protein, partial [Bryocella sp.]
MRIACACLALGLSLSLTAGASITEAPGQHTWTLTSGSVEYRIGASGPDGAIALLYFGPSGRTSWTAIPPAHHAERAEIGGMVNGQPIRPEMLKLEKQSISGESTETPELHLLFRHTQLPLEVEAVYTTYANTGVITKRITFHNIGTSQLMVASAPSLSLLLPPDAYEVSYLHGGWGRELQLQTAPVRDAALSFVDTTGRSSNGFSPWFVLHDINTGVRYGAQLAYSGNWQMNFNQVNEKRAVESHEQDLSVTMGMRFDFGGDARLLPGKSLELPEVAFTASNGDLDDVANQFHRYQRRYVFAHTPTNSPPLVTMNVWQVTRRNPKAVDIKRFADLIAPLGMEALIIDSGWFEHEHHPNADSPTDPTLPPIWGNWEPDSEYFPKGLSDVADYTHAKGMKFGVW